MGRLLVMIVVLLAALTITSTAQDDHIRGALGFELKTTRPDLIKKAIAKGWKHLKDHDRGPSWEFFTTDDKMGGYDIAIVGFQFNKNVGDRLAKIIVAIDPSHRNKVLEEYLGLKSILEKKYGAPSADVKKFTSPYEWGDGHELTAIAVNKADIWSEWKTPDVLKDNVVQLILRDRDTIHLMYFSEELMEDIEKAREQDQLDDF